MAPSLICHILFYFLHGEKVFDDLPVTATSATMAKWINREMDSVLSSIFDMHKRNPSDVSHWQMGSKATGTTMGSKI